MNEQNLGELLARRADMSPDLEAYVAPIEEQRFDYRALNSLANRCSAMLSGLGLAKGDRLALLLNSSVEFVADLCARSRGKRFCGPRPGDSTRLRPADLFC